MSWPDSRTGKPSSSSAPKASASAVAQSMPSPLSIAVAAVVEEAKDGLVDLEALRRGGDALADLLQAVDVVAGVAAAVVLDHVLRRLEAGPAAVEPVGLVGRIGLARLEFGLEPVAPVAAHLVDLALGDEALARSACRRRSAASSDASGSAGT